MKGRKNIRLQKYDYTADGYYFVTVVSKNRENIFIVKEALVEQELSDLKNKTLGVDLDYFTVMPNHIHVIFVLRNCSIHLGEVARRLKAKVSHAFGEHIRQANYYEHVIQNETALSKIREYIINNPQELLLKFGQFYK